MSSFVEFGEDSEITLLGSPFPLSRRRLQPTDSSFSAWLPFRGEKFPLTSWLLRSESREQCSEPPAGQSRAPLPEQKNPAASCGGFAPQHASLARFPDPVRCLEHQPRRSSGSWQSLLGVLQADFIFQSWLVGWCLIGYLRTGAPWKDGVSDCKRLRHPRDIIQNIDLKRVWILTLSSFPLLSRNLGKFVYLWTEYLFL